MFDSLPPYQKRLQLIQLVSALPPIQFDELVFALEVPQSMLPGKVAPQAERSAALLNWAESSTGPGLLKFEKILENVVAARKLLHGWAEANIEEQENVYLTKELKSYLEKYRDRHGKIKFVCLHMDESIPLDSIYTTTKVVNHSESEFLERVGGTKELSYNPKKRKFESNHEEVVEAFRLVNQEQYLTLLGSPGSGKSTFLRKVGLEALTCRNWNFLEASDDYTSLRSNSKISRRHPCIPVFIELKQITAGNITIKKLILKEFSIGGFQSPTSFMERALQQGRLLILFDGFDEVQTKYQDYAMREICDFVDRYSLNRFILSCRRANYIDGFYRFKNFVVADFEDSQIERFIYNWFDSDEDQKTKTAQHCWNLLKHPEYESTKDLAKTPLLLTLLCAIYNRRLAFPKNRSSTYGAALDVVLKDWAAEKRVQREPIYQELSIELEMSLLSEIAYENFLEDDPDPEYLLISKKRIVNQIRQFLMNNLNASKKLNGEKVLGEIEIQQGILVKRAKDTYSFSHLTLQEYLVAQWIVDNDDVISLINNYLTNVKWREVFLLVSGLLPGRKGADKLLIPMNNKALDLLKSSKFSSLFRWAERITKNSTGKFSNVAKKIAAISLLFEILFGFSTEKNKRNILIRMRNITFEKPNIFESMHNEDENNIIDGSFAKRLYTIYELFLSRSQEYKSLCSDISSLTSQAASRRTVRKNVLLARIPNRDLGVARIFSELNILEVKWEKIISNLKRLQEIVSSRENSYEVRARFLIDNIHKIWLSELKIELDIAIFSEQEIEQFNEYIYVNELIIRCKESAVKVTPQAWGDIEENMFSSTTFINREFSEEF